MYKEYLRQKFQEDTTLEIYVSPHLPASKLGRILSRELRVKQPGDVVVLHVDSGFFSSGYVLFTEEGCLHPQGEFLFEDLKTAENEGDVVKVLVNRLGAMEQQNIKTKNEAAARMIAKVLSDIKYSGPNAEKEALPNPIDYQAYEGMALDWLKLRDEVMRTIDLLYAKFQDGKLSLIEYEGKKAELLARL